MKLLFETGFLLISGFVLSLFIYPVQAANADPDNDNPNEAAELSMGSKSVDSELVLISKGTATWLWLEVYDAELSTTQAIQNNLANNKLSQQAVSEVLLTDKTPIKLQLCYQQKISAKQIIEAAEEGLPEGLTNSLQTEVNKLHNSYQSVKPGDCYALQHNETGETLLSFNGKEVFRTAVPAFKAVYFGIWIGDLALSKSLKEALLKVAFTNTLSQDSNVVV